MSGPSRKPTRRRRKWWKQFRMSTLLVAVTIAGIWMAVKFNRNQLSVANITELQERDRLDVDIWKVRWSADGRRMALVGWETPVTILDGVTLWELKTVGEGKKIIHFAFSDDDDVVAYCENPGTPVILDSSNGKSRKLDTGASQWTMAFSPDGTMLAGGSYFHGARVWDVATGKEMQQLDNGSTSGGLTPVFSPDGRYLAVGNRNAETYIFNTASWKRVQILGKPFTHELAFHPTRAVIAVAYVNGSIGLWDFTSGQLLHLVQTGAEEIYTLSWSPDGSMLASAGLFGSIDIWNGDDLTRLHTIDAPEWAISVRFRPDMRGLVVAGGDRLKTGERYVQEFTVPSFPQKWSRSFAE